MQLSFEYEDTIIEFTLTKSRRKTLAIIVEAPGRVSVKAPVGLSDDEVISRVKSRAKWIVQKLYDLKNIEAVATKKEFVNGELFLYLGRSYSLQLIIDKGLKKPVVNLYNSKLIVTTPAGDEELIKKALEAWYRSKAKEQITERIKYYQLQVGAIPARVTVKEQKKRWGSCSSKGNLNFNWKAVMAPSPVLDYIIVHELCHLIHLNHSRQYWDLVAAILPDYKKRREWLKENAVRLSL